MRTIHAALVSFMLLSGLAVSSCKENPALPEDRELFVTVAEIEQYTESYSFDTKTYEKAYRTLWFDSAVDLTYEFESPDDNDEQPLYLNTEINCSHKSSDTAIEKTLAKGIISTILESSDLEVKDHDDIFQYNNSKMQVISYEGYPVGNILYYTSNKCLYTLLMSGVYIGDPKTWQELMIPKLDKLEKIKLGLFELNYTE